MSRWAVFDVDGTLLPGDSMEKRFLKHLLRSGTLPFRNLFFFIFGSFIQSIQGQGLDAFKNNKIYLKDLPHLALREFAGKFFYQHILPAFSHTGFECLESCRTSGYRILIMSGSPDFLTRHMESLLKPDYLIATEMEIRNERYTGNVTGLHLYGHHKRGILLQIQKRLDISFDKSVVFANHHADIHHMELFGRAVAINPTRKLKQMAIQRGWNIETWR